MLQIKVYNTSPEILGEASKASDVLLVWLKGVLEEHRLNLTDICSATSDSGSDIKRLLPVLLPGEWAWCISHIANCALIEAMGTYENTAKSKNMSAKMDAKFKDLQLWRGIRIHYLKNLKGKRFPLQDVEIVLPQCFALVYPMSDFMKGSQALHQLSSGKTLVNMAQMKTRQLNPEVSIKVSTKESHNVFCCDYK